MLKPASVRFSPHGSGFMITTDIAIFRNKLPDGGRLAGLDVGSKTIGLAVCDAGWVIASSAETLKRTKFTEDFQKLSSFIATQNIKGLVVGHPLSMDGTISPQTQSVRGFARNVERALPDLPILLWDERWSTQAVTRTLIDADASRKRRAELVDKLAASYILQGAIDGLRW